MSIDQHSLIQQTGVERSGLFSAFVVTASPESQRGHGMMRVSMALPRVEIPRRPSMAFFAILAFVMVIGSYLFVALLATGSVYLPYIIFSRAQSGHGWDVLILLFGLLIAATMLWSLIPRREAFAAPGLLLNDPVIRVFSPKSKV